MFWLNALGTAIWTAMLPITLLTTLKTSVPFVAALSIYALMVGHMASALAALAGKSANESAVTLHATDERPGP